MSRSDTAGLPAVSGAPSGGGNVAIRPTQHNAAPSGGGARSDDASRITGLEGRMKAV